MANLTKFFHTTKHLIESGEVVSEARYYLGMSQLGSECARELWYSYRWMFLDKTSKRMVRLWNRGHREEEQVFKILEEIGYLVDREQQSMEFVFGHVQGHNDGTVLGVVEAPKTVHLIEIKTIADKYFNELCKKTLIHYSATYYGQCQLYMHFLKLTRALFIAVNKNDDNLYIERIKYDKGYAEDLIRKGESIVLSDLPPERAYPSRTFFKCKWCAAKDICWNKALPEKNCRTCAFGNPNTEGRWDCSLFGERIVQIPKTVERVGCGNYQARLT